MSNLTNEKVKAAFNSYPADVRSKLKAVRRLILSTARNLDAVGKIEETLKWGEPAYLTSQSKSGSTIRIGWKASKPTQYAVYFNCQTTLVDTFRTLFPEFRFEGNRAILFDISDDLPEAPLGHCIELALTYHLNKRRQRKNPDVCKAGLSG